MFRLTHWLAVQRYRRARYRHSLKIPFELGDPSLGSGEQRKHNIAVLLDRWAAQTPKPEDFGLSADLTGRKI